MNLCILQFHVKLEKTDMIVNKIILLLYKNLQYIQSEIFLYLLYEQWFAWQNGIKLILTTPDSHRVFREPQSHKGEPNHNLVVK